MVDRTLVLKKLATLAEYRRQLVEFTSLTVTDYRSDWKIQRIVERTLQMMIELCADVAGHLIADRRLRTPETYADTFRVLGENGLLAPEQTTIMEKMAKFRNVVVHQYETVDAEIVILVLQKHLDDFDQFGTAIVSQLDRED